LIPKTLSHWYQNGISHYKQDTMCVDFAGHSAYICDEETGEVVKEQIIHIMKPKNIGSHMCIDEKRIGKRYCTKLTNAKNGKIAMLLESMNPSMMKDALSIFGDEGTAKGIANML
jgi:hypothetical protein